LKYKEHRIPTNKIKFESIIGDHTRIGSTVVLNPGTVIGKNCQIEPMTLVKGFVPAGSIVKSKCWGEITNE